MGRILLTILFILLFLIYPDCPCQGTEHTLLVVEIQAGGKKEEVFHLQVKEGTTLTLAYTHSMFLTQQKEFYTIRAGGLILREIGFGNLEAANYYDPNPRGLIHPEGSLWKINPSCPVRIPVLRMRIPYTVNLSLMINHSIVWIPKDEDRGALLIVRTNPDR